VLCHVPINVYYRVVKSAELSTLVVWLLEQCGSPEMEYRHQCMSLLSRISTMLPGGFLLEYMIIFNTSHDITTAITTANSWIRNIMDSKKGHYFVKWYVVLLWSPVSFLNQARAHTAGCGRTPGFRNCFTKSVRVYVVCMYVCIFVCLSAPM